MTGTQATTESAEKPEPIFEDLHPADDADDPLPLEKGERKRARADDAGGIDIDDPFASVEEEDDEDLPPRERIVADAEDGDDEGEDEEEASYSKRARARIARERRLKEGFRNLAAEAIQRANLLASELAKLKGGGQGKSVQDLEAQIKAVKDQLRQAKEDGETDRELELEEKLVDLRVELRDAQRAAARQRPGGQQPSAGGGQQAAEPVNPYALEFMHRHRRWWNSADPRAVRLKNRVMFIEGEMRQELAPQGISEYDDRYWRELDKRLARELPQYFGARRPSREQRTPTVGMPRVPTGGNGGRRVERLSRDDIATMRTFGLDPSNKDHVAEFLRNRAR